MAVQIQFRNDTAAAWAAANPILAAGELGLENDTNQQKMGNGVATWSSLPYSGTVGPTGPAGARWFPGFFSISTILAKLRRDKHKHDGRKRKVVFESVQPL